MSIREDLNDHDVKHRTEFADYATHHAASDWHREYLARLYEHWGMGMLRASPARAGVYC
jgi:hypothetical protein